MVRQVTASVVFEITHHGDYLLPIKIAYIVHSFITLHLPVQLLTIQDLDSDNLGHGIPSLLGSLIIARPLFC